MQIKNVSAKRLALFGVPAYFACVYVDALSIVKAKKDVCVAEEPQSQTPEKNQNKILNLAAQSLFWRSKEQVAHVNELNEKNPEKTFSCYVFERFGGIDNILSLIHNRPIRDKNLLSVKQLESKYTRCDFDSEFCVRTKSYMHNNEEMTRWFQREDRQRIFWERITPGISNTDFHGLNSEIEKLLQATKIEVVDPQEPVEGAKPKIYIRFRTKIVNEFSVHGRWVELSL